MSAKRAAINALAMEMSRTNPNDIMRSGVSGGDLSLLAKEYLILLDEKSAPDDDVFAAQQSKLERRDIDIRTLSLELAVQTGVSQREDILCTAYCFRAFLLGNQDEELLKRMTPLKEDEDIKQTSLYRIVLGDEEDV